MGRPQITRWAIALLAHAANAVVYTHSTDSSLTFDTAVRCSGTGNALQRECVFNFDVLSPWQTPYIDHALGGGFPAVKEEHYMCGLQHQVCLAMPELKEASAECTALYSGCQQALRHLHKMMFNQSPEMTEPQVCNNFARKSIRGFFHDFMSNAIDGSILSSSEHHIAMNFGLCRWAQYINVLSDETMCDPGSIIAMAGELGYEACGVPIWEQDFDVKPGVTIGRAAACGPNLDGNPLFDLTITQRSDLFSDAQTAVNATAMEEMWYVINGHTHGRPDGEVEYSAEASAAAHAVGRVTCPPDGTDLYGNKLDVSTGFFHRQRSASSLTNKEFYREALSKFGATQCDTISGQKVPSHLGKRAATSSWPHTEGETELNPEGGFCGMPTQFLGTVSVGSQHRIPRWISITENSAKSTRPYTASQSCTTSTSMYIPLELFSIANVSLPSSTALGLFEAIAWDGYDTTDSAWDSCEVGCAIPVQENRLCGGAEGLAQYDYSDPFCSKGIASDDGTYSCCSSSLCDDCASSECSSGDGCCPEAISTAGRECKSAWDVGCTIPRTGDGGVCSSNTECTRGICKGGRCCNAQAGADDACGACGFAGGNCESCADGFKKDGVRCVGECACSSGCVACGECAHCSLCDDATFLSEGQCFTKASTGGVCSSDEQCASASCKGGNCCDANALKGGCLDCNYRGLCDECDVGYTLCDHSGLGHGQCNVTHHEDPTTTFVCGTGDDFTDYPSSDGFNYCASSKCPCANDGCYSDCALSYTCWLGSDANVALSDYVPPEFMHLYTPTPAPPTPTPPTPTPPTPTPPTPTCVDRDDWRYKKASQNCAWTQGREWRCSRTKKNKPGWATGYDHCPMSCGTCPSPTPPTPSPPTPTPPTPTPPTPPTPTCVDSPDWRYKKNKHNCAWTQGKAWRCAKSNGNVPGAATATEDCPVSCGTCI